MIKGGTSLNLAGLANFSIKSSQLLLEEQNTAGAAIGTQLSNVTIQRYFNFTNQNLMPKLAEWHIYGNEQQGRFVLSSPPEFLGGERGRAVSF